MIYLFLKNVYRLILREKERERANRGGAEREREREREGLTAGSTFVSAKPNAGLHLRNLEDHDLSRDQESDT